MTEPTPMNNAMDLGDSLERLRLLAETGTDQEVRFFASRLNGEIEVVLGFKSEGMYTEAKYTAGFLKSHAQQFASDARADSNTRNVLEAIGRFVDDVLLLPDTVRTVDPSAAIAESKKLRQYPPGPYAERYPVGSPVRIAPLEELEEFMRTWKLHHALVEEQLKYAGMLTIVRTVGYYHGGDVIYTLEGTGKLAWLERCLRDAERPTGGQ
jgi:hypothetical protein